MLFVICAGGCKNFSNHSSLFPPLIVAPFQEVSRFPSCSTTASSMRRPKIIIVQWRMEFVYLRSQDSRESVCRMDGHSCMWPVLSTSVHYRIPDGVRKKDWLLILGRVRITVKLLHSFFPSFYFQICGIFFTKIEVDTRIWKYFYYFMHWFSLRIIHLSSRKCFPDSGKGQGIEAKFSFLSRKRYF